MSRKNELVDVSCVLCHETDDAILVSHDGEKKTWLPKSMVEFVIKDRTSGLCEVTLPTWKAKAEGFI